MFILLNEFARDISEHQYRVDYVVRISRLDCEQDSYLFESLLQMILLEQTNNLFLVQLIQTDRGLTYAQTFLQNHFQTLNFMHIQQQ